MGWIPQTAHSRGLFPFDSPLFYVLGGVGPMLAAFIVLRLLRGKEAYQELFGPLLRWRIGGGWYIVALLGYPAIWLISIAISRQMGPELETVGPILALLPVFLISLVAAVPEEVAWPGFTLPRLQARRSALTSSLIVGVLWALWHLLLLLNAGNVMSTYLLMAFFLTVVARSVVYTWLYNSTGVSVATPSPGIDDTALARSMGERLGRLSRSSHEGPRVASRVKEASVTAITNVSCIEFSVVRLRGCLGL